MDFLVTYVVVLVATTLAIVILAMVGAMVFGLFVDGIDNNKIFELVSPAFQTIVGGMIGILSGVKIGSDKK